MIDRYNIQDCSGFGGESWHEQEKDEEGEFVFYEDIIKFIERFSDRADLTEGGDIAIRNLLEEITE